MQTAYIDLEFGRNGRLYRVGALREGETFEESGLEGLAGLDRFVVGADVLVGHNLLSHDLQWLREHAPDLRLHALPVVDTLVLSALAWAERPYHRLVKDYKLVADSLREDKRDVFLVDGRGVRVAALSKAAASAWLALQAQGLRLKVLAVVVRDAAQSDAEWKDKLRVDRWLVPVCEARWLASGV